MYNDIGRVTRRSWIVVRGSSTKYRAFKVLELNIGYKSFVAGYQSVEKKSNGSKELKSGYLRRFCQPRGIIILKVPESNQNGAVTASSKFKVNRCW